MRSRDANRALAGIGAFVLPIALVKATAFVLSAGGPADAGASPDEATAPVAAPIAGSFAAFAPAWSAEAIAAREHGQALADQPFGPSPMVEIAVAPQPQPAPSEVEGEPPPALPLFSVSVQSIMASPQGDMAVVNGRVCRVGDRVDATNWTVDSIDARERTVTFRVESTGESITRRVRPN
jgi:hypothetical protein